MRMRQLGVNTRVTNEVLGTVFQYYLGSESYTAPSYSQPFYPSCKITWDEIHPRHPYEGGPFESISHTVAFFDHHASPHAGNFYYDSVNKRWVTIGYCYRGKFRAIYSNSALPPSASADCAALGAEAWEKLNPYKTDVGLAQAIAELRDVKQLAFKKLAASRDFVRRVMNALRKGGGDYLAVQFGWKPMVQDFLSLLDSVKNMDQKIAKLRDQNGKWQRKNATLFENATTTVTTGDGVKFHPANWSESGTWTKAQEVYERSWTQGAMKYYVPALEDPRWGKFNATRDLWDLNITPKLLYQLTPWSWLLDWFSNASSVIGNLQSQISNQVASKYAYVMLYKKVDTQFKAMGSHWYNDVKGGSRKYVPVGCSVFDKTETKNRSEADPLGFGFDWNGLTAFQSSILAALGLSRLPRR